MNHLIDRAGLHGQVFCDSAGTSNYHIGEPPDRRMTQAAREQEIVLQGQARQLQHADLVEFDWILAMDRENYRNIVALDPAGDYRDKVHLMCEFCTRHSDKEVPDPYFGGTDGFQYVMDLLLDACEGLLHHITQTKAELPRG